MQNLRKVNFDLRSFQLVTGFEAVFAVDEKGDGLLDLISEPIDAIGVAEVCEEWVHGQWINGKWFEKSRSKAEISTCLVAMRLMDGWWQILEENDNYAGMMKSGENIENAVGCLTGEYLGKLRSTIRCENSAGPSGTP